MEEYIAHKTEEGKTQTVKEHLEQTAKLAEKFASSFGADEAGYMAGILHDIGKYSKEFQEHIRGNFKKVDHSTAGAMIAWQKGLYPISFAVAGHHGGIPDGGTPLDNVDQPTMFGRIKKAEKGKLNDYSAWENEITLPNIRLPEWVSSCNDPFTISFFIRMLYSCLVDADYLDTENFMNGAKPRGNTVSMEELLKKLRVVTDKWLGQYWDETSSSDQRNSNLSSTVLGKNKVNIQRNRILRDCINKGKNSPRGLYTLTVPTGGGKTIASLSFALEQAVAQGMDRIIYVIPYTSIIDQTVEVFKGILGDENVLAHYSEADYFLTEEENLTPLKYRCLLASENWDAPVIVTTTVQFFESLYADHSSKCRKLHSIANSVIIFDEAQSIPRNNLRPCVAAIAQLVSHYRSTAVLCTATQPELAPMFKEYGILASEICEDKKESYRILKRTKIQDFGQISEDELERRLSCTSQVLCVVNRRKTAQEISYGLPEEGRFCLTTLLCGADRRVKLQEIRERLKEGLPCRVVSTSLIEAGVDVDFPEAWREQSGLDSLLQTAGRCNREGKEQDPSKCSVYLFKLEGSEPITALQKNVTALRAVEMDGIELDKPEAIEDYFQILYTNEGENNLDQNEILDTIKKGGSNFPFHYVEKNFCLISDASKTVYIPIGEGAELCRRLINGERSRTLFRKLGPYSVSVYDDQYQSLNQAGALMVIDREIENASQKRYLKKNDSNKTVILNPESLIWYDSQFGLRNDAGSGQALFL